MPFDNPKKVHKIVQDNIAKRSAWEQNQQNWFNIRFFGIGRDKQFDWQSDLPFKLSDSIIERVKAQDVAHVYNGELLAEFTSIDPVANIESSVLLAQRFDHELRNNSNFGEQIHPLLDMRCMYGGSFFYFDYNYQTNQVEFRSFKPLDVVLPQQTKHIDKAANFCIIEHISPIDYVIDGNFTDRSEAYIKKLIGGEDGEERTHQQEKDEGAGFESDNCTIEVRHFFERTPKGWFCYFYSPNDLDKWLRQPYELPYEVDGHGFAPITWFPYEISDTGGIYDARGIVQKVSEEEAELTRLRNMKLDNIYLSSVPYLESSLESAAPSNLMLSPMKALPAGISVKYFPQNGVNYDAAMNEVLSRTEQRVNAFDNTITDMAGSSSRRSATESEMIGAVATQGTNYRYKILRNSLCETYKKVYAVWKYHNKDGAEMVVNGQLMKIPAAVKDARYSIQPAGSELTWSKERRTQQAGQIYQMLANSPTFQPFRGVFEKYMLQTMEPRLAAKYNPDQSLQQASQREEQLSENLILDKGIRLPISPTDDNYVHALTAYEDVVKAMLEGRAMGAQESQAKTEHIKAHLEALKGVDAKMHADAMNKIAQMKAQIEQAMSMGQGGQQGMQAQTIQQ